MTANTPLLIGSSPAIAAVRAAVEQVADTDATVLVHGETGTGKELVALLDPCPESPRRAGPFVAANCGGFVPGLAASELFGHEPGRSPVRCGDALGDSRRHSVERSSSTKSANSRTHFNRSCSACSNRAPSSASAVTQSRSMCGSSPRRTATSPPTSATDRFRADLFYRLNVFPIAVPPLRERRDDIPELVEHFLRHFAAKHERATARIPARVLQLLAQYDWPGNVRELRNVIERAVIVSNDPRSCRSIPRGSPPPSCPGQSQRSNLGGPGESAHPGSACAQPAGASTAPAARPSASASAPPRSTARCGSTASRKEPPSWQ